MTGLSHEGVDGEVEGLGQHHVVGDPRVLCSLEQIDRGPCKVVTGDGVRSRPSCKRDGKRLGHVAVEAAPVPCQQAAAAAWAG